MPSPDERLSAELAKRLRDGIDQKLTDALGGTYSNMADLPGPMLTAAKLAETMRELESIALPRRSKFDALNPFRDAFGMDVIVAPPPQPKIQWRQLYFKDGTPMGSPKAIAEMNAWLIERFGFREDMFKDRAYVMANRIIMSNDWYQKLKKLGA